MIEKFNQPKSRHRLIEALCKQPIINGNKELANEIADVAEIEEFAVSDTIIVQDNTDDEIIFILAGQTSIVVNGREVAIRKAGEHIGEMALIDPSKSRSASAIATQNTVTAKVSEGVFSEFAERYPKVWKYIAQCLSERLIQRNASIQMPNPRPTVFIGSSSEALPISRAIQSAFQHDEFLVRLWTDKVFGASNLVIEDLEFQIKTSDFAILVISADDKVVSREVETEAPRDNVVFELGLFMGALTRKRTFLATPKGYKNLKIPTDLLGVTSLTYSKGEADDLPTLVAPMCNELRSTIKRLGPR